MCFSTIYIDFKGRQKEVMGDGALVKAGNDAFLLIDRVEEERFVQGRRKVHRFC